MSDEIPPSWHAPMERKGITVSYRGLGERAGISHETARRVVTGRSISPATAAKVADALGVDREVVYELRGQTPARAAVWEPPATSSLLTPEEREALNRLVHLLTAGRRHKERENDGRKPAPMNDKRVRAPRSSGRTSPRTGASRRSPDGPRQ